MGMGIKVLAMILKRLGALRDEQTRKKIVQISKREKVHSTDLHFFYEDLGDLNVFTNFASPIASP